MALKAGKEVEVARQGGLWATVVDGETRPGQVLVRFDSGVESWVPSGQVHRARTSGRASSSHPPQSGFVPTGWSQQSLPTIASHALPDIPGVVMGDTSAYSFRAPQPSHFYITEPEPNLWWLLFRFEGRVGRAKYWWGTLAVTLLAMAVSVGFNLLLLSTLWGAEAGEFSQVSPGRLAWMGGLSLLMLPVIWASLAISVKRWHDRNKSGWWVLIALIPVVGGLWTLIENGFLAGSDGPNRYGEDPRSLR